jgi:hypothetical protein
VGGCRGQPRHSARSSSTGKQTGQGTSGKDLEVGAVDELLFGEYVVRARYMEEKNFSLAFPSASRLSTYIITNNIIDKTFIFKPNNDFQILMSFGISSNASYLLAKQSLRSGLSKLMVGILLGSSETTPLLFTEVSYQTVTISFPSFSSNVL